MYEKITYPAGYKYYGIAKQETMHFEFLKTYSLSDSRTQLLNSITQAAQKNNITLLKSEINYQEGIIYHIFDVITSYKNIGISLNNQIQIENLIAPLLIELVVILLIAIVVLYWLVKIEDIIYGHGGTLGTNKLLYYLLLFGVGMFAIKMIRKRRR